MGEGEKAWGVGEEPNNRTARNHCINHSVRYSLNRSNPSLGSWKLGSKAENFQQKINSAEDGIDGTNGYFRRNSGCPQNRKLSEFRSELFRGRKNNSEFYSVEQK
jgi:hypothetical protein